MAINDEFAKAIETYIAARLASQSVYLRWRDTDPVRAQAAWKMEQDAWEVFWPIKQKHG